MIAAQVVEEAAEAADVEGELEDIIMDDDNEFLEDVPEPPEGDLPDEIVAVSDDDVPPVESDVEDFWDRIPRV